MNPSSDSATKRGVTRRKFLQGSLGAGALVALGRPGKLSATVAAGDAATGWAPTSGGVRRGLVFDDADGPRIRATLARPEFAAFWASSTGADLAADTRFLTDELDLTKRNTHLLRATAILQRTAFTQAIAPEERQLALARLAYRRVMDFPRWDWILEDGKFPVGVMRGASTGIAVICALDWLGDALGDGAREAVVRRVGEEMGPAGFRAVGGMTHHEPMPHWSMDPVVSDIDHVDVSRWPEVLNHTNLRIIATSGLAAAACFLKGRHPDAEKWFELSRDSLRRFAGWMPADESFPEGPGYWGFTFTYYLLAVEMLRRTWGADERAVLDFPTMARYTLAAAMPTLARPDDCVNIGDANTAASVNPLAWIAREFRDSTAQAQVVRPGLMGAGDFQWAAIWFDATVPPRIAPDVTLDREVAPGLVLSRSGWALEDRVVCLRSGGPVNHEHADRNSVLFAAWGERLINDPLHASYSVSNPLWLLRQTEAHSAVLIDGRGHAYHHGEEGVNASKASATLLDHRVAHDWMRATSDATDAYRLAGLPVQRVVRTIVFLKTGLLIVFDAVDLTEAKTVEVRFQAYNDDRRGQVSAAGATFAIERPGAVLHGRVAAEGEVQVVSGRLDLPATVGVYPFAAVRAVAATRQRIVTAASAIRRGGAADALHWSRVGKTWRLTGTHAGQALRLTIEERAETAVPIVVM
ncbi:heparinase II/III family protein [Horticoccus luteus]|uniref:Heparinase II/III family protein n=1 Tax=Horticoccus luteus TaxID=2862869 RepID=A0A8F9XLG5_9BACT|nr:heparinase II/III family protein [Horticoccus luteus]QYM79196.1 heparinase II/III family protein [Horticoccus luteus]